MKKNIPSIFWGILLILAGAAMLADRLGWVDFSLFSTNTWVYLFAGLSLVFLLSYLLNGVRQWGWLFPTFIFAALSLTIWMSDHGNYNPLNGMPILLSIALPFYIGWAFDRKSWGLLIPAWVLTVLAGMTLTAGMVNGDLVGALFLYAVAAPFLVVYLTKRTRWWALIPAWVLFILGTITLLSQHVNGDLIGALFLYSVALPFLVVYLANRTRRWALITALAIAVVGTIPLLSSVAGGDWMGAAVMILFSLPFFFVYFRWQEHWWALIPAGVFASIGAVVLLSMLVPENQYFFDGLLNGVLLLGLGLTFGALWLRRESQPTAWARYPAIGLLIAGLVACFSGGNANIFWSVALLLAGIALVVYSFLRNKPDNKV